LGGIVLKEVNIKLCIPFKSEYTNKNIKFEVESSEEFEKKLIEFFFHNNLKEMIDSKTGFIKNIFAYVCNEKVYHNIKEIKLNNKNDLTIFAYILGG